jgi:RNA polymerase sigma-32 factor
MASQDTELSRYIERVRALPVLDREEEMELARRARAGERWASDRLVESSLRYAVAVALQYRRYGLRLADLVAEGNLGLMMAVRKFDPERGVRFVTYAGYWIRAYVLDYVVRSTSMVGAGSGPLRSKVFFKLRRERAKIAGLVLEPEEREALLAERMDTTPERVRELVRRLDARDVSLDAPLHADGAATLGDALAADWQPQDEQVAERERERAAAAALRAALSALDRRERYIVEQRLMADEEVSLADLGRKLGVSRERARQLEARAKRKLEKTLAPLREHVAEALPAASGWR